VIQADYLLTFAEIGVALAGFSSLIALLGSRTIGASPAIDAIRLQVMLEASLSVVPLIPDAFGARSETTWRLSALTYLALDVLASYVATNRWRSVTDQFSSQDHVVGYVVVFLSLGADFLFLPLLFGFLLAQAHALYLTALVANLALAGVVFIRFASSTFLGATGK
jgi:hypothetical protein